MLLSVIVPAFNEIATIGELLRRVQSVSIEKEIIVVDDCSTDGTREYLQSMGSNTESVSSGESRTPGSRTLDAENLRIIYHDRNRGKGAAIQTGLREAKGDMFIIQDADLEYDPEEYRIVLKPILEDKADVVYGSRFLGGPHRVLLYWHQVGNRLLTTLSNALTNLNLTDMETCYKAFTREVLESISLVETRFGFEPEFTAKIAARRWRVYEVPVSYQGRTYDEGKKISWPDGLKAIWCILRYNLLPGGKR